ncbi:MAG TPA: 2Fe-2S ferredoxin [Cyanobacteria bacterium UBA11149]|nr:2Fe-2S ferredoxin [Cyanobacteria bacterium UBA11367]HBE58672.1 2Fe-2S ferredoxin [Cyanobacteria bacterium UBA11366]HBK66540.1 2Fe-2S ferredoxin [Cyanobacteria bacterium UBA11166]HBR75209.1 2Fe-2S ferredoxin [Cyanobacteria bacterium UBA11159]HBS70642.1 2Fe-2S ferredoxin [Cyanobacteria bacterium UBA11153]HBW89924.1 2Fe-2S ferredoxin [Cyanobacteria bacterium UBA11149]HCA97517.1 2Fe-2S ferredoxin [Cyanobacteria bacterium UBA9226]
MPIDSPNKDIQPEENSVLICQYRSCLAAGSAEVLAAFEAIEGINYKIVGTGCQGQCSCGPTVRIVPEETWYCRIKPSDVPEIVAQHLVGGSRIEAKLNPRIHIRFSF